MARYCCDTSFKKELYQFSDQDRSYDPAERFKTSDWTELYGNNNLRDSYQTNNGLKVNYQIPYAGGMPENIKVGYSVGVSEYAKTMPWTVSITR